jgi:hypothetical protein
LPVGVRAKINQIPPDEEATWGAVFASLSLNHRNDWRFHWTAYPKGKPEFSVIEIEAEGEDVDGMRAEIEEVIDFVNAAAKRDPLNQMVVIDAGHVEVLVS